MNCESSFPHRLANGSEEIRTLLFIAFAPLFLAILGIRRFNTLEDFKDVRIVKGDGVAVRLK